MSPFLPPTDLPVEESIESLKAALTNEGQVVLTAEPGAGKTTVVPLRLLDEPWLEGQTIVMLEPRRMAARAAARRMASLLGEEPGQTVGWITRDDRAIGPATRLIVMTEGVLTARLIDDPGLSGVGLVIFDEFHERSVPCDLGLALFLHGRADNEHRARLLVMSATIEAEAISSHLGGAAIVTSPGRTYPIEIVWHPKKRRDPLAPAVRRAVMEALRGPGDVLVFLPGVGEIRQVENDLAAALGADGPVIMPLHGSLPAADQDAALISRAGRRIVLSTNIAETSLTVDGITAIVDAGLERVPRFDPRTGMSGLHLVSCSKASADQRAGRAGRLGPGVAIRLWSKAEHAARPSEAQPAIVDEDMTATVLDLARRGFNDWSQLPFLTPPTPRLWEHAVGLLQRIGALDTDGSATRLGVEMARLPVHPRLARMVVGARKPWLACVAASVLDDRDLLRGRPSDLPIDLAERVRLVVDDDAHHERADRRAVRQARSRAGQLARRAGIEPGLDSSAVDIDGLGAVLAAGFPDRVARPVNATRGSFVTASGQSLSINRDEPLADAAGVVAVDFNPRGKRGTVNRAARLEARLDHLIYATPDLDATVASINRDWGVAPTLAGQDQSLGVAYAIVSIGQGAYLEITGPTNRSDDGPRPYGLDEIEEARLVGWSAGVPDLELWLEWCRERKVDPGPAKDTARETTGRSYRGRITVSAGPEPAIPSLVEWAGPSPVEMAATGVELLAFTVTHPDGRAASRLREYALPQQVTSGPASIGATLLTPTGMAELNSLS